MVDFCRRTTLCIRKGKSMSQGMIDRRALLQFAAAGSTLLFSPRTAMAADTVSVGAAGLDVAYAAIYVAIKKGYFAQAGLAVEHINSQSGPRGKQMLSASQIFASSSGSSDSVALTMAGKPAVLVFNMERRPAAANVIVHKDLFDAGLKDVKGLKGRKIGITQPQGWTWLLAAYIAEAVNLKDSIELKALGDFTTMLGAVKAKSVDGCIATFPMVERAVEEGWGVPIFQVGKDADWQVAFKGDLPGTGLFVLQDTVREKPEQVAKLVAGLVKASDFLKSSSADEIADVIQADYLPGTPKAALVSGINQYKAVWNYDNEYSPEAYASLLNVMGSGRMYPTADLLEKAKYADAVDMSFVRKARAKA
jgi:NitT/TauT family transport system substrate-binding protein